MSSVEAKQARGILYPIVVTVFTSVGAALWFVHGRWFSGTIMAFVALVWLALTYQKARLIHVRGQIHGMRLLSRSYWDED
jgi:hypothetical protein